jgi:hypothetical protein
VKKQNKNTPQQEGINFEKRFSKKYQSERVPGSGNGVFYKMDSKNSKFLWSLKHTSKKSYTFKSDDLKEVQKEVYGPGGIGLDYVPAMAIELEGEVYCLLLIDDMVKLLEQNIKVYNTDKAREKRERAKTPRLLREEENFNE